MTARIFCAIDTPDVNAAVQLVQKLAGLPLHVKLGLEFFTANGVAGVQAVRKVIGDRAEIFLDVKFHDIPNTVAGAMKSALLAKPQFMTVHASGGIAMMKAAVDAAKTAGASRPKILAVTVLTSLDENELAAVGQGQNVADQVLRLAKLAAAAGVDGVVCSPHEIEILRRNFPRDFLLVVPGIRPAEADKGDQKRTLTPEEALKLGASYLVIGRPITEAADPADAARRMLMAI